MLKLKKVSLIRFLDKGNSVLFEVEDGGLLTIEHPDGRTITKRCCYVNEFLFTFNGKSYHVSEFTEMLKKCDLKIKIGKKPKQDKGETIITVNDDRYNSLICQGCKSELPFAAAVVGVPDEIKFCWHCGATVKNIV